MSKIKYRRTDVVNELDRIIENQENNPKASILTGFGGYGKTTIATEYEQKYIGNTVSADGLVCHIKFKENTTIKDVVIQVAESFKLKAKSDDYSYDRFAEMLNDVKNSNSFDGNYANEFFESLCSMINSFAHGRKWIILFDNVDYKQQKDFVMSYLINGFKNSDGRNGLLIVTSRLSDWDTLDDIELRVSEVPVEIVREYYRRLCRKVNEQYDDAVFNGFCDVTGRIALAISQAETTITKDTESIALFVEEVLPNTQNWAREFINYEENCLYNIIESGIRKLKPEVQNALFVFSLFHSAGFSKNYFVLGRIFDDFRNNRMVLKERYYIEKSIADSSCYSMHPRKNEIILDVFKRLFSVGQFQNLPTLTNQAVLFLAEKFPLDGDVIENETASSLSLSAGKIIRFIDSSISVFSGENYSPSYYELAHGFAKHLYCEGKYDAATEMYEIALKHLNILQDKSGLYYDALKASFYKKKEFECHRFAGNSYRAMQDERAIDHYLSVINGVNRVSASNDLMDMLAQAHYEYSLFLSIVHEDMDGAIIQIENAMSCVKSDAILGVVYRCSGIVYRDFGDMKKAYSSFIKALNLESGINKLRCYNNLGLMYMMLEDYKNAQKCYLKAEEMRGDYSGYTTNYVNHADCCMCQGEHDKAKQLLLKGIEAYIGKKASDDGTDDPLEFLEKNYESCFKSNMDGAYLFIRSVALLTLDPDKKQIEGNIARINKAFMRIEEILDDAKPANNYLLRATYYIHKAEFEALCRNYTSAYECAKEANEAYHRIGYKYGIATSAAQAAEYGRYTNVAEKDVNSFLEEAKTNSSFVIWQSALAGEFELFDDDIEVEYYIPSVEAILDKK